MSLPEPDSARNKASELLVAWSCLAVLMVIARAGILSAASCPLWYLPIAAYQDIVLTAALCGLTLMSLKLTRRRARLLVAGAAWTLCLMMAAFTVADAVIFRYLRTPLNYRLLVLSDATDFRGVEAYVAYAATPLAAIKLIAAPVLLVAIAKLARRLAPNLLREAVRILVSAATGACLLMYFLAGSIWASRSVTSAPVVANAEWSLIASFFDLRSPRIPDSFPPDYVNDFRPVGESAAKTAMTGRLAPGTNVVMVVMESVGARRLELCGAPYHDSPELLRLSQHAANLTRMYASMPWSSSAMAGLFCSLYPNLGLRSITQESADLAVPSLASVLTAHGYHNAFIYAGPLIFDREGEFLRRHGFQIPDGGNEIPGPRDQVMLDESFDWIARNRAQPLFLVLWTKDTHAPYAPLRHFDYGVKDPGLTRYLDGIASTDALIGRLAARLDAIGLGERTLLVVIGDHGEAFGEHGHNYHNLSAYEEEVRIPFLIVNRGLFARPQRIDLPAQQIDVAPTVLDLLGYQLPAEWQGRSVFAQDRRTRVYLFADMDMFRLGMIDGSLKYIYDYDPDRSELYDLNADSREQENLADDPRYAAFIRDSRRRLAAWVAFQNGYLGQLEGADGAKGQAR